MSPRQLVLAAVIALVVVPFIGSVVAAQTVDRPERPTETAAYRYDSSRAPKTATPAYTAVVKVVDGDTGMPLAGAHVRLPRLGVVYETDSSGRARIPIPRQRVRLRITAAKSGYTGFPLRRMAEAGRPVAVPLYQQATQWPMYGYDAAHRRTNPSLNVGLPGKQEWRTRDQGLLEFAATLAYGIAYYNSPYSYTWARRQRTGEVVWRARVPRGRFASQPAVSDGVVYVSVMDGSVRAYDALTGHRLWTRRGMGRVESSPLIVGRFLYVGDWNGTVWSLDKRSGRAVWRTNLGAKITSSAAYARGTIYIGRYAGVVCALNARTGAVRWRFSTSGNFYGSPTVTARRVVIGNSIDGAVYCLGAGRGRLLWRRSLGDYVYASPAVWRGKVYVGAYTGVFHALSLRTGATIWSYGTGGPISGAATVIDGVVYFSNLRHHTYGLDARTGRRLWHLADGRYSPVTATRGMFIVAGHTHLYGFRPRG